MRPGADWKDQPISVFNWVIVLNAGVLLLVVLYQWWEAGGVFYVGMALVPIAWGLVYFTDYWQPILYLVVSAILFSTTIGWILTGAWMRLVIQILIFLNLTFTVLSLFLFYYEESALFPFKSEQ